MITMKIFVNFMNNISKIPFEPILVDYKGFHYWQKKFKGYTPFLMAFNWLFCKLLDNFLIMTGA